MLSEELERKLAEPKKKTAKKTKETDNPVFPVEGFVNPWGFIHLSKPVAEAFGTPKGKKALITIDMQEGALIIRKA